jgi:hypothetical protein
MIPEVVAILIVVVVVGLAFHHDTSWCIGSSHTIA